MIKLAAVLGITCFLAWSAHTQVISDGLQKVGGGGRSVAIAGDRAAKPFYGPTWMTSKMIYTGPGRVIQRIQDKDQIILVVSSQQPDGTRDILLAGYPDAANIAVDETAPCVAVMGPVRDDLGARRIFYFFSKDDINDEIKSAFEQRHPGVPYR